MRLFNKNPQHAFEWLPKEKQKRFSREAQLRYGKSKKSSRILKAGFERKRVFDDIQEEKVRSDIKRFYDQLCNYTHPNFLGWQELVGQRGESEIVLNMPRFSSSNTDKAIGITLYLMQLSFKAFVETFKDYLGGFVVDLKEWQDSYSKLIVRYVE